MLAINATNANLIPLGSVTIENLEEIFLPARRLLSLLAAIVLLQSCNLSSKAPKEVSDMGEKVRVGSLIYNVIEAEWKSQLGAFPSARTPESNFLLIHLSVTNGGGAAKSVPILSLENSNADTYQESTNGQGVDHWFGVLRQLPPAVTDEGWILFDVPTNGYRLRITDTDADGTERVSFVKIPLKLQDSAAQ